MKSHLSVSFGYNLKIFGLKLVYHTSTDVGKGIITICHVYTQLHKKLILPT